MKGEGCKNDDGTPRISEFKKVYSRHKRRGKDPNRVEDLLGSHEDNGGVIDVLNIACHHNVTNHSRKRPRGESIRSKEIALAENSVKSSGIEFDGGTVCFGKDLVYPITSQSKLQSDKESCERKNFEGFGFHEFPGVYIYPRALSLDLQEELAYQAVTEYCELNSDSNNSHRTNLDLIPPKPVERVNEIGNPGETMWSLWKGERKAIQHQDSSHPPPEKKPKHHKKVSTNSNNFYRRFSKLSWATMGYHYDWTERSYHPEKKSTMPDLVARLSTFFATANHEFLGRSAEDSSRPTISDTSTFIPSASIVNYYTTKSTMGGHRDDLEDPSAMDKPIVSISLGLPGIFILGGSEKEEYGTSAHPVRAILLRKGDVLVMGGSSRLNFHAMARVLPHAATMEYERKIAGPVLASEVENRIQRDTTLSLSNILTLEDFFSNGHEDVPTDTYSKMFESDHNGQGFSEEQDFLKEYLEHHRININIRQVYPDGSCMDREK